jgi:hypothetical protein
MHEHIVVAEYQAPRDLEQTLAIVNRNHDIQDMSWGAQVLPNDQSKPDKAPRLMSVIPKALVPQESMIRPYGTSNLTVE